MSFRSMEGAPDLQCFQLSFSSKVLAENQTENRTSLLDVRTVARK